METTALEGGFTEAATDAALAFRSIMKAMARPGQIERVGGAFPPAPLSQATGVVLLTLCDPDTPIFLASSVDKSSVRDWIAFHTGAPIAAATEAHFAVGRWNELAISDHPIGTPEYPDRSTTVIVEVDELTNAGPVLSGPGIAKKAFLNLPETEAFQRNSALYPLGLDFIFTHNDQVAALPRSTKVS